jgi:hypothetical protein
MDVGYDKFYVGQKVWIENPQLAENADMIRNPQVIENIMPIPVTHKGKKITTFMIDIKDSPFLYQEIDLKPYEENQ